MKIDRFPFLYLSRWRLSTAHAELTSRREAVASCEAGTTSLVVTTDSLQFGPRLNRVKSQVSKMPVRDRLQELRVHRKRSTWGSFRAASRPMAKKDKNIASVLQLAKDTQVHIDALSRKTDELRKVYSDIIASPFMENTQLEKLHEINVELTDLSDKIQIQLDSINPKRNRKHRGGGGGGGGAGDADEKSAEHRVRLNQYRTLNARFRFISSVRRQAQLEFEDKGRQRIKRQLSIQGKSKSFSDEAIDVVVHKGNFAYFYQEVTTDDDSLTITDVNKCMKQEEQVLSLESDILHLHTMFKDLKVSINEQGEIINSIQHSLVRSVSYVEEGTQKIAKAKKYVKKVSKTKILLGVIFCVTFVCALLVIVLFLVLN